MFAEKPSRPRLPLQLRNVDIQVHPVDCFDLQLHVFVENLRHGLCCHGFCSGRSVLSLMNLLPLGGQDEAGSTGPHLMNRRSEPLTTWLVGLRHSLVRASTYSCSPVRHPARSCRRQPFMVQVEAIRRIPSTRHLRCAEAVVEYSGQPQTSDGQLPIDHRDCPRIVPVVKVPVRGHVESGLASLMAFLRPVDH